MARRELFPGLVMDDEIDLGWVRVEGWVWVMARETWLHLQYTGRMNEASLMLDLLGPGLHQLPGDMRPGGGVGVPVPA